MRIAYLAQSYPPMISGASIFAKQIAEDMSQRGHQVLVIAASDKPYTYLIQKENLCILLLRSFHNPMRVGQRFLIYPRYAILNALQEFCPDAIHTHDSLQIGMLGLEYANRSNIPITLTTHQLPWFVASYLPESFRSIAEKSLWVYARWVLKKYTCIIAPTRSISEIISQKTGLNPRTISYGLDFTTFFPRSSEACNRAARQKWNIPWLVPILLHVGRLDTDKHVDRVIQAIAPVVRGSDAHLLIVGDGIQKPALVKQCSSLGILNRTHFTGYVSVENGLADIYRMASLFITASEIETQGIVLLEAAASGLPLVATRATCLAEIVHHGVNGYLTESQDLESTSDAIFKILNNPDIAKSMGLESRMIAEKHNAQKSFHEYEKLYLHIHEQFHLNPVEFDKSLSIRKI